MTNGENEVIRNVIAALQGEGRASDEIKEKLADPHLKLWLDTWVIAPLQFTQEPGRDIALAKRMSR